MLSCKQVPVVRSNKQDKCVIGIINLYSNFECEASVNSLIILSQTSKGIESVVRNDHHLLVIVQIKNKIVKEY